MIPILISERLKELLASKGIDPTSYGPAYNGESAGLDLYYAGQEPIAYNGLGCLDTDPRLVPTGLRIALPRGLVGLLLDRGSISKTPMIRRAGVIDPMYTGEIFVNMVSIAGDGMFKPWSFNPGDKLPVQLVVVPFVNDFNQVSAEQYQVIVSDSKRLDGKVGSSD